MITFTIPGQPVGKGRTRPRFGSPNIHILPKKTVNYQALVAMCGHQAMAGQPPLLGAVEVELDIRVQIPASWSKRKQQQALLDLVHPTTKPDIDNVEKAVFDGLNGVAWKDDVQVVRVSKRKRYADEPGVGVEIRLLDLQEVT